MLFKILWIIIMAWCILQVLFNFLALLGSDKAGDRFEAFFKILGKAILVWYLILSR